MRYETRIDKRRRRKRMIERVRAAAIMAFSIIGLLYITAAFYVHY